MLLLLLKSGMLLNLLLEKRCLLRHDHLWLRLLGWLSQNRMHLWRLCLAALLH